MQDELLDMNREYQQIRKKSYGIKKTLNAQELRIVKLEREIRKKKIMIYGVGEIEKGNPTDLKIKFKKSQKN